MARFGNRFKRLRNSMRSRSFWFRRGRFGSMYKAMRRGGSSRRYASRGAVNSFMRSKFFGLKLSSIFVLLLGFLAFKNWTVIKEKLGIK